MSLDSLAWEVDPHGRINGLVVKRGVSEATVHRAGTEAYTTGRATYFAREYSDCRLLPLDCILLQNMTFKLRQDLLGNI